MQKLFANRSINLLNIHYALQSFATGLGDVFGPIYLYQIGLELWQIFCVWIGVFLLRLLLRPISMKVSFYFGLQKSVQGGALLYSTLFVALLKVNGLDIWLLFFLIINAITDVFYWLPYHTYFALLGDKDDRGKQVSVRDAFMLFFFFLGPIVGALLVTTFSFVVLFLTATVCMLFSAIPLWYTPVVTLPANTGFKKAWEQISKTGLLLYAGHGLYHYSYIFTWSLVLFIFLEDYILFGGLLSLAILFQMAGVLTIGNAFDQGNGKRIFPIGLAIAAMVLFSRIFFVDSMLEIVFFDLVAMLGFCLYRPIMGSAFYNMCKKSHHPLWYQFFAEAGWDIGGILATSSAALFLYFDGELRYVMLLGIFGIIVMGGVLRWYFQDRK